MPWDNDLEGEGGRQRWWRVDALATVNVKDGFAEIEEPLVLETPTGHPPIALTTILVKRPTMLGLSMRWFNGAISKSRDRLKRAPTLLCAGTIMSPPRRQMHATVKVHHVLCEGGDLRSSIYLT